MWPTPSVLSVQLSASPPSGQDPPQAQQPGMHTPKAAGPSRQSPDCASAYPQSSAVIGSSGSSTPSWPSGLPHPGPTLGEPMLVPGVPQLAPGTQVGSAAQLSAGLSTIAEQGPTGVGSQPPGCVSQQADGNLDRLQATLQLLEQVALDTADSAAADQQPQAPIHQLSHAGRQPSDVHDHTSHGHKAEQLGESMWQPADSIEHSSVVNGHRYNVSRHPADVSGHPADTSGHQPGPDWQQADDCGQHTGMSERDSQGSAMASDQHVQHCGAQHAPSQTTSDSGSQRSNGGRHWHGTHGQQLAAELQEQVAYGLAGESSTGQ